MLFSQVANAAEILVLAHLHSADNLRRVALDFVAGNLPAVRRTSGYACLEKVAHKEVLVQLIEAIANSDSY